MAAAAELVLPLGLEVGGRRVEEEQVHLEVQQVGDALEHAPLQVLLGVDQHVHGAVELVKGDLVDVGEGDVTVEPLAGGAFAPRTLRGYPLQNKAA